MQEFHFPNWVNRFTLVVLGGGAFVAAYLAACLFFATHPTTVNIGYEPRQPVPFSHRTHAGKLKLDCRYCHTTVHEAAYAAIPPTATCGNCHGADRVVDDRILGVVHPDNDLLEPVRRSLETRDPVEWIKVHNLPDYVYFNHAAHINRGVSCVSCHGRVDQMEVVSKVESMSMKWCLDCHREPERYIRDPALVTQLDFEPADGDWLAYGSQWAEKLNIFPNTSCSTCHR